MELIGSLSQPEVKLRVVCKVRSGKKGLRNQGFFGAESTSGGRCFSDNTRRALHAGHVDLHLLGEQQRLNGGLVDSSCVVFCPHLSELQSP